MIPKDQGEGVPANEKVNSRPPSLALQNKAVQNKAVPNKSVEARG